MIQPNTEYNMTIYVGLDFEEVFIFKTDGVPLDLSNCTAKCQVRIAQNSSSTLIVELTAVVSDPTEGEVTLSLTDTQTKTITKASGFYCLVITDNAQLDYPFAMGVVKFQNVATSLVAEV